MSNATFNDEQHVQEIAQAIEDERRACIQIAYDIMTTPVMQGSPAWRTACEHIAQAITLRGHPLPDQTVTRMVRGKFYVAEVIAGRGRYWGGCDWVINPIHAAFYDSAKAAEVAASVASGSTKAEVVVCFATKNITGTA